MLCGRGGGAPDPILFPINVFRLLSSVDSSFNLLSVASFWESSAFGIKSLRPRTSSSMRLLSSPCLLDDSFRLDRTLSTSPSGCVGVELLEEIECALELFVDRGLVLLQLGLRRWLYEG